jgi:hypothetical protein
MLDDSNTVKDSDSGEFLLEGSLEAEIQHKVHTLRFAKERARHELGLLSYFGGCVSQCGLPELNPDIANFAVL